LARPPRNDPESTLSPWRMIWRSSGIVGEPVAALKIASPQVAAMNSTIVTWPNASGPDRSPSAALNLSCRTDPPIHAPDLSRALLVVLGVRKVAMLLYLPWSVYWVRIFSHHLPSLMPILLILLFAAWERRRGVGYPFWHRLIGSRRRGLDRCPAS